MVVRRWYHKSDTRTLSKKIRLSTTTAKAAQPEAKGYTLWDDALPGFGLYVGPGGAKTWIVKYRIGGGRGARQGKMTIAKLGQMTAAEAREAASKAISKAKLGDDPREGLRFDQGEAMTVNAFLDAWQRDAAPFDRRNGRRRKERSVAGDIRRIDIHVRPLIGHMRLADLTSETMRKLRSDIAEGKTAREAKTKPRGRSISTGGDGTAVQVLRILKSALGFAVENEWIDRNPMIGVKLPPTNARDTYLSDKQWERLGAALDEAEALGEHPHALNIIRLLALTGARRGEIESLRWRDVDLERGFVVLPDTKTGRAAWPLSRPALELLASLPREQSPYVFPAARGDGHYQGLNNVWPRIRARAGLEGVRLHDLRHSFASVGAGGGVGLPVVGKLLGHKQAATTARYAHIADDPLRAAADKIGGTIAARLTRAKPKAVGDG